MRTKEEAYKMFKGQEGKSADEIIKWYKDELFSENYCHLYSIHDWQDGFQHNLKEMDGKEFQVSDYPSTIFKDCRLIVLRKLANNYLIIAITLLVR